MLKERTKVAMDGWNSIYMLAMEGSSNNYGKKQVQELGSVVMMKLRSMAVIFLIVLPGIAT